MTERVKYNNENHFIENLAVSNYSRPMWANKLNLCGQTNLIINVHFAFSSEVGCPVM